MTAQELRIGNLYYGSENTIGVVEEDDYMNWKVNGCWAKPIPIEQEWLLSLGFKRLSEKRNWFNLVVRGELFMSINLEGTVFLFGRGGQETLNLCIKIEFIHQLQNLFFALTGEELKTKK